MIYKMVDTLQNVPSLSHNCCIIQQRKKKGARNVVIVSDRWFHVWQVAKDTSEVKAKEAMAMFFLVKK